MVECEIILSNVTANDQTESEIMAVLLMTEYVIMAVLLMITRSVRSWCHR
jgi:hypothetical protein